MDTAEFKEFQEHQSVLAEVLSETSSVAGALKMSVEGELAELSEKVRRDTFKIMITGTFKNGKSALINALLGEEILPSYALPCTAVINEIKYGDEKRAFLYFKDKYDGELPSSLAPEAVAHLKKYGGKKIPPLEIPYDEIEKYAVIPIGVDPDQMKLQTPYEKIELYYPLELLKNGVEIIDSPGLNEDEIRTKVTMGYLQKVDAVIYVLNATAITAADEMRFVANDLAGNDFDSVFFVVNKLDVIQERERDSILKYASMKLSEIYPNAPIFGLSAIQALDGRKNKGDGATLLTASGIVQFEQRLTHFLTKEKGKAKLTQPAKRVRYILSHEAQGKIIPAAYALLDSSLQEVTKKYNLIVPRLATLKEEKTLKRNGLSLKISRAGSRFERMAQRKINEIASSINAWVNEFTPKTRFGMIPTKAKAAAIVAEIAPYVQMKIKDSHKEWKTSILLPEIEATSAEIFASAEKDFGAIFSELDDIHFEMGGNDDIRHNPVSFWQRVAGVAGGLVVGDVGLAISGGLNGIGKEFAKTVAFELGAGFVLACIGLLNPVTIVAVLVSVFIFNRGASADRAMKQVKQQFVAAATKSVREAASAQSQSLSEGIVNKFEHIADQITKAVDSEIEQTRALLTTIKQEKDRGQNEVDRQKQLLSDCEAKIQVLNAKLDTLIFALVEK